MAFLDTQTDARQTAIQVCPQDTSYLPGTIWHGCWICTSNGNSWSVE